MGGVISSLNSLIMIFLMIIPGIVLSKRNMLSETQIRGLNSIIVNVTWPCLVIDGMQIDFSMGILKDCGYTFVLLTIVFAVAFVMARVLAKGMNMKKMHMYQMAFMLLFANTAFMGIPVVYALYGKKALFYGSIIDMISDIFLFTVGILFIQMSAEQEKQVNLKSLINPGIIGVTIGFILFLLNLKLPGFLGDSIHIIGSATSPLSMIIIGLHFGQLKIKELFGDWRMYVMTAVKLLVIPGVLMFVLFFVLHDTSVLSKVIIMEFAMPAAMVTVVFSGEYKSDVAFATKGVMLSTLLSILTLPIFTVLLEIFS